jgi:hypothetical protein
MILRADVAVPGLKGARMFCVVLVLGEAWRVVDQTYARGMREGVEVTAD